MNDEINSYLEWIEELRGQVSQIVAGLPVEALNWRPVAGTEDHATNSLAVLAAHVAGAEHHWIAEVVGKQPATRHRPDEFVTEVTDAAELVTKLTAVHHETRQIFSQLTADSLDQTYTIHNHTFTGRWCILHVIEHTALHLGHMQLTYQLWQNQPAADSA